MIQPGRKYEAESYRYSINGQEKEKEINENTTSAEFWIYDSRIGRRWNVDPKPTTGWSLYATFGNNPIIVRDQFGDTTIYSTSAGAQLFVSYNKGRNAVVFIGDDMVETFKKKVASFKYKNAIANDKRLQALGTVYDLKGMEDAYANYSKKTEAIDNVFSEFGTVDHITDKFGSTLKLYSEYGSNIILQKNKANLGTLFTSGRAFTVEEKDRPIEDNTYGNFHMHSNQAQRYSFFTADVLMPWAKAKENGLVTFPGPSPGDRLNYKQNRDAGQKALFNIMIDEHYIFFYTDKATISINRSEKAIKEMNLADYLQPKKTFTPKAHD